MQLIYAGGYGWLHFGGMLPYKVEIWLKHHGFIYLYWLKQLSVRSGFQSFTSHIDLLAAVPAGQLGDPNTTQADQELEPEATQDTIIDPGDVTIEDVTGNDEATSGLEETMPLEAVEPSHHNNEEVGGIFVA